MKRLTLVLVIIAILLTACPKAAEPQVIEQVLPPGMGPPAPPEAAPETSLPPDLGFQGKVLAGTTTPYIEFSKADYDVALQTRPYVVLYFYANWCPICKAEQPLTFAAFNELQRSDMVGFRVNYRDSETDDDEVALAKQFGVTYQHTKVVLKDGKRILKSPETWSKQDYLDNLGKI